MSECHDVGAKNLNMFQCAIWLCWHFLTMWPMVACHEVMLMKPIRFSYLQWLPCCGVEFQTCWYRAMVIMLAYFETLNHCCMPSLYSCLAGLSRMHHQSKVLQCMLVPWVRAPSSLHLMKFQKGGNMLLYQLKALWWKGPGWKESLM